MERIKLFVERGRERIVWKRVTTFCVAKGKEKFFDSERWRISQKKMCTGRKFKKFLCLSVPKKKPRNYVNVCGSYELGQVQEY